MSSLIWKIKQLIRQVMPLLLIAAVAYTGYSLYRYGILRRGFGPAFTSMVRNMPVLGSRFKRFSFSRSYSYSGRHYRKHHGHRRHHRHHRRHRRHR